MVRHDGGSNDYERDAHWQAVLALQPAPEETRYLEDAFSADNQRSVCKE